MLTNPAYAGDVTIGKRRTSSKKNKGKFNRAAEQVSHNPAMVIVPREVWDAVQAKMAARKDKHRRTPTGRSGTLTGVLYCGHCGHTLAAHYKRNDAGETIRTWYTCNSPQVRPAHKCRQWRVDESEIMPVLIDRLVSGIDGELLRTLMSKPEETADQRDALRTTIAKLEKAIELGTENLYRASAAIFPKLQARLEADQTELDKARNTLAIIEGQAVQSETAKLLNWWTNEKTNLMAISTNPLMRGTTIAEESKRAAMLNGGEHFGVTLASKAMVRDLLKRLNTRVHLTWTPNGNRYFKLEKAHLRADFGEHVLTGDRSIPN